ncbi:MAG: InlB B-repeat-containing protein [Treponema sp.]|jgi:hypothetical protein|nr:InlB B-repeat-containing protein [Treponema sp.]
MKNRAFMKKALLAAILCAALSAFMGCDDGSKDPETYTVTYNANGGSGSAPSAQTVNAGSSVTLSGQGSLTYSGKTFNGWNTNSSGAGTAYAAGASLTVTGNITLYAQWGTTAVTPYTVTYNANGGSGNAPSAQTANSGSSVTLSGQGSLTYSGKTFNGWNTNSAGTGTAYAAGASLTVTGNITLYAQWGTAEGSLAKNITVYMEKPNAWSQLYAYVWDDGGTVYSEDAPGTALTAKNTNGYYSFQANQAEYGYINVRFSNGGSSSSIDILGVEDDTYYKSAGTYLAGGSELLLRAGGTAVVSTTPMFTASEVTDSTVTLTWNPVPGADSYILYDEWVEFDDDEEEIPGSEYWHFQKTFGPSESSIYDDNYGEYLDPESVYTWKLVAVKYKANADLSGLNSLDPDYISEDDYAPYYDVVYNFGELEVETDESSLPAPTNLRVVDAGATSVELAWNAVPDADYYMVWWYDEEFDEWLYIEEAYTNRYIDDDDEFIFPNSSYKYLVVAHNERTYSKDSNEVTAYTSSNPVYSVKSFNDIARASSSTPSAPYSVSASANPFAASQIIASWSSVSGATKYEVGLFVQRGGNPKTSKTVSNTTSHIFTSVSASPGVYYVGVRAVNGSKKSGWTFTSSSVSPFPKVSIQSAKPTKTTGGYKTITIIMNASWKAGASYGYSVTVTEPNGKTVSGWVGKMVSNTNTITIPNVSQSLKYTVTIRPYTGGAYGSSLLRSGL